MKRLPLVSRPVFLLHSEAFCILMAAGVLYYWMFPLHWMRFAALFLIPDLTLLLYASGWNVVATMAYNLAHSYVSAALLSVFAFHTGHTVLEQASLIWIAHISFDRLLGYGLKYPGNFRFTHLQSAADEGMRSRPTQACARL